MNDSGLWLHVQILISTLCTMETFHPHKTRIITDPHELVVGAKWDHSIEISGGGRDPQENSPVISSITGY